MNRILYFDLVAGISGDMTVGALLDLLDESQILTFIEEINKINLSDEFEIEIKKQYKQNIFGTKFNVIIKNEEERNITRNIFDIESIINNSKLSSFVKTLSNDIFLKVALAESKIHGKVLDEVHFHEVGAIDSIVDIVSTAILIEILKVTDVRFDKIHVGCGFSKSAHGMMPIPVPATLEILKGYPTYSTGIESELVTPTGAAILTTLAADFGKRPNMNIEKIGYGLGTKDLEIANVLRVYIANVDAITPTEELVLIETNIDDMSSEVFTHLFEKLFSVGALDVFTNSVGMKKNRPGVILSILANHEIVETIEEILFIETSTFGIRKSIITRVSLSRRFERVITKHGEIKVKIGYYKGRVVKVTPEYEDIKNIANILCKPFIEVYNEAVARINEIEEWN